jgi:hypothetical protein
MLRITLAVRLPARRGAQVSVVPPRMTRSARRAPALVRRLAVGHRRTGSVVVAMTTPRGWTGLSLAVIVRFTGGRRTVTTRGALIVHRTAHRPTARLVYR